jgi:hypothetical protein
LGLLPCCTGCGTRLLGGQSVAFARGGMSIWAQITCTPRMSMLTEAIVLRLFECGGTLNLTSNPSFAAWKGTGGWLPEPGVCGNAIGTDATQQMSHKNQCTTYSCIRGRPYTVRQAWDRSNGCSSITSSACQCSRPSHDTKRIHDIMSIPSFPACRPCHIPAPGSQNTARATQLANPSTSRWVRSCLPLRAVSLSRHFVVLGHRPCLIHRLHCLALALQNKKTKQQNHST